MASSDIERRINRCTDDFVSELERLIVEAAQACVRDALKQGLHVDLSAAMDWKSKTVDPIVPPKRQRVEAEDVGAEEADEDADDDSEAGRKKKRSKHEVEAI